MPRDLTSRNRKQKNTKVNTGDVSYRSHLEKNDLQWHAHQLPEFEEKTRQFLPQVTRRNIATAD